MTIRRPDSTSRPQLRQFPTSYDAPESTISADPMLGYPSLPARPTTGQVMNGSYGPTGGASPPTDGLTVWLKLGDNLIVNRAGPVGQH